MNYTLSKFIMFATGAIVGSLVTWKILDIRYERRMNEESKSIKTELKRLYNIDDKTDKIEEETNKEPENKPVNIHEYSSTLANQGYTDYNDVSTLEEKGDKDVRPYVIEPDRFGEIYEYETISFTYYADGVLADELDERVEDIDNIIGEDSLKHFGEYEDDSVFVRNDELKCDYEILLDSRKYSDVVGETDPDNTEE